MKVIETTVFKFEELDDDAKEIARTWYRSDDYPFWQWWDFVYEDFERICKILGVEIADNRPNHNGGKGKQIYFSGFWSQGDGASFFGSYTYKKGSCKAIREYNPKDKDLHQIADTLRDLQKTVFYDAYVSITEISSHYCHSNTMTAHVESYREVAYPQLGTGTFFPTQFQKSLADDFLEAFRDLAHWLYSSLQREYEWMISDEYVDDMMQANEYDFLESGKVF